MKTLISGGTGLVGKELGKALATKNHEIFILTRNPKKAQMECPFPHKALHWKELESRPEMMELDHIIHLAGTNVAEQRWNKKFKDKIYNSRVQSTKKLAALAKRCPHLKSFVSTSAIGIYGDTGEKEVLEDHNPGHGFMSNVCQNWEKVTEVPSSVRKVIFRVGVVFSEKGGALEKLLTPIQAGVGGPLATGQQFMSWIDIEDLVNLYVFALENPIQGVFNAVAPHPIRNQHLTRFIGKHLGRKTPFSAPYFALRILVGEIARHLVESQKINSQKIQNQGFRFLYPQVEDSIKKRVTKSKGMGKRMIFEQWIPKPKEEVFSFFSEVKNLERVTPPSFHLKTRISIETMGKDTLVSHKLRVNGIPICWQSLITEWNPPHQFTDIQKKGPFKKWNHTHSFKDLAGGTLITDQVDLEIPFGIFGYTLAGWKIFRDVEKIFTFRHKTIRKIYGLTDSF